MKSLKKVVIRIFVISAILVVANYLYSWLFFEKDIQEHSPIINALREVQDEAEYIYFGESSNFTTSGDDTDKRSISSIINDSVPDKKILPVSKGALHAEQYYTLIQNIPDDANIEGVIVTLNLRSFGADWIYSKLETALDKSMVLLRKRPPLLNRFILSFKAYDIKTDKERHEQVIKAWEKETFNFPYETNYKNVNHWERSIAKKGLTDENGEIDWDKTILATHYVKSYAFYIDSTKNPRIKDFDKIVRYCKKRNLKVIFNLMAENTEKAEELIGEDLLFLMHRNRDILVERYSRMGAIVVDNLDAVPDEQFIDQNWTTEHYAQKGRQIIAGNVVCEMLKN